MENTVICPRCGSVEKPGFGFCSRCGNPMSAPQPAAQPQPIPQPVVQAAPPQPTPQPMYYPVRRSVSGLAIAVLVLALVGALFLFVAYGLEVPIVEEMGSMDGYTLIGILQGLGYASLITSIGLYMFNRLNKKD